MLYAVIALAAVILILTVSSVRKVPPETEFIIERMGSFYSVIGEGVHFVMPLIDRVAAKVSLAGQCLPLENVTVVSADGKSLRLSAAVHFSVSDAQKFYCGIGNAVTSLGSLTLTAFRDVISSVDAAAALDSQGTVEKTVLRAVSAAAEQWGLNVSETKLTELSLY